MNFYIFHNFTTQSVHQSNNNSYLSHLVNICMCYNLESHVPWSTAFANYIIHFAFELSDGILHFISFKHALNFVHVVHCWLWMVCGVTSWDTCHDKVRGIQELERTIFLVYRDPKAVKGLAYLDSTLIRAPENMKGWIHLPKHAGVEILWIIQAHLDSTELVSRWDWMGSKRN